MADPALQPTVKETAEDLTLETAEAQFTADRHSGRLTMQDKRSGAAWTLSAPGCQSPSLDVSRTGNAWTLSAAAGQCRNASITLTLLTGALARLDLRSAGATKEFTFHVEGGGPYFGLGKRFWQTGLAGTHLDARPQDRYGEPGHNWTYMGIPLLYTPGGLGMFADTAHDLQFSVDQVNGGVDIRAASATLPLYLFVETDPKSVLTAYTGLTGRPPNPPLWEFGPWITSLQGKGSVLDYAHRLRVDGIPASALWVYDELDEARGPRRPSVRTCLHSLDPAHPARRPGARCCGEAIRPPTGRATSVCPPS